ncbi:MAG: hypothetical protein DRP73_05810, partial [Candidatus Omnitrophota bacterium]
FICSPCISLRAVYINPSPVPEIPVSVFSSPPESPKENVDLPSPKLPTGERQRTEVIYNPDTQELFLVVYEYHPGIASYEVPSDILPDLPVEQIERELAEGWVVRGVKVMEGVDSRTYQRISDKELMREKTLRVPFQHEYIFEYEYRKDEGGEFKLYLDVVDIDLVTNTVAVSEQIPLVKRDTDISDIRDPDVLIDLLIYEPDAAKREQILERLSQIAGADYISLAETIVELLYSPYPDAEQFLTALEENKEVAIRIGQPVIPLLIEALRDGTASYRDYLEFFSIPGAEVSIKSALQYIPSTSAEDQGFKRALFSILGEIGGISSLPLLFEILESNEIENSGGPLEVLAENCFHVYPDVVLSYFRNYISHSDPEVRRRTISALENLLPVSEELASLVLEALNNDPAPEVRAQGVRALARSRDSSVLPHLIMALQNEDSPLVKRTIIWNLGNFGDPSVFQYLLPELTSENPESLRKSAVMGISNLLENISSPDEISQILDTLLEDLENPELSSGVFEVLSLITMRGRPALALNILLDRCVEELTQEVEEALSWEDEMRRVTLAKILWKHSGILDFLNRYSLLGERYEPFEIYIWERTLSGEEEYVLRPSLRPFVDKLCDSLLSDDPLRSRLSKHMLAALGAPAIEHLIERLKTPLSEEGASKVVSTLALIGNFSFLPVVVNFLDSEDEGLIEYGLDIIQGLSQVTGEGIDPDISPLELRDMDVATLVSIAQNSPFSLTRAISWYYLGKKMRRDELEPVLRSYIFEERDSGLYVSNEQVSKLEMAAILYTGVPGDSDWWERLADRTQREAYLRLVLKGDFTDERNYIYEDRLWLCSQFAKQLEL